MLSAAAPSDADWVARLEESIDGFVSPLAEQLSALVFYEIPMFGTGFPLIVGWLVLAGIIFTVYFGVPQIRQARVALKLVRGRYDRGDEPGEVSHFQALTSAMSATVGLGNIAGVGVAMTVGGPGAVFWMIIAGLFGMCSKFVECTLGVRYRVFHEDGTVSGGPMLYLRNGIAERLPGALGRNLGKFLAVMSCIFILAFGIAGGNMFQINQTFAQFREVTGGEAGFLGGDGAALIFGVIVAALIGVVLIGGIKSIGRVTAKLVPGMTIFYVGACLIVIGANYDAVPAAIGAIFEGAFTSAGVAGGAIGALIVGFQRAAFSNEAGLGSAPIAHSAVKTRHPVTEGYVSMLEPFIDSVVINTISALAIITAAPLIWQQGMALAAAGESAPEGVTVTSAAFGSVVSWFPIVLAIAVALFAISTALTWGYYGQKAWTHLFGRSPFTERLYQALYAMFAIIGAVLSLGSVLDVADAVLFLLAFFNILGLYVLAPIVKEEMRDFAAKLRSGEISEVSVEEAKKNRR